MTWDRWITVGLVGWIWSSLMFAAGIWWARNILSEDAIDRVFTKLESVTADADAGDVHVVDWCVLHDIPWASHDDVGLTPAEFCNQRQRVMGPVR